MDKEYKSRINLNGSYLNISVDYERPVTKEDVELQKDYFQFRFSQGVGKNVPRDEIKISPCEGEPMKMTTTFRTELRKPLYIGLQLLHAEAPYVLPRLIEDLKRYEDEIKHAMAEKESRLIQYAQKELGRIASKRYKILTGKRKRIIV